MTSNQLTRERLEKIKSWREIYGAGSNVMLPAEEAEELARIALAAMDSEPVAWTDKEELSDLKRDGYAAMLSLARQDCEHADPRRQILLFTHPAPARQRDQVRREHAEWSQATFGNVGPVGPLKHLSKEALEAAAEPGDLSEWADMQFLMWDAQRRAGITDEQITQAMFEKLAVNKQRSWPEPKDGEPRLHIKAQPAPEKYNIGDATMRHIFTPTGMTNVSDMQAVFDRVEAVLVGMEQPAPVVPDGYVMVPMRLTAENGAKGALSGEFSETKFVNCPECFGDDECETCNGSGRIEIKVPVSWTTIKEIWIKGVEHFAAAPQENN